MKCGGLRAQERTALFSLFSFRHLLPPPPSCSLLGLLTTHTHFCTRPNPGVSLFHRQEVRSALCRAIQEVLGADLAPAGSCQAALG